MTATQRMLRLARVATVPLGRVATVPLGVVVAVPVAAGELVGSAWAATRAGVSAVTAVAESVPRLARQAERILDAVEPPAVQVATSLDVNSVDQLVLSLRAVPDLVAAMLGTVARFEVFVAEAEATRDAAGLTVQHAAGAVADAQLIIARTAESVDRAAGVVTGGELLVREVSALTQQVSGIVNAVDRIAGLAGRTAETVSGLVDMAQPAVELSVELSRQAQEPARILLDTAEDAAPAVAEMTPVVLTALRELADRLPDLLRRIDSEVLPTVRALQRTPSDVRALRDTVQEIEPKLGEVEAELAGLPGAKALRRRGRRSDPEKIGGAATVDAGPAGGPSTP